MRRRHRRPKNWVSPCERRLDQRADVARRASDRDAAGEISPDGRWLAYHSNESGRNEVYVRPFPNVDGGRWQISTGGGSRPAWSGNGRELFYFGPNTAMMVVAVQTTPTFSTGNPSKLFDGPWFAQQGGRTYDVSRDGQRFLMIKDATLSTTTGNQPAALPTITVVLNWNLRTTLHNEPEP